MDHFVGDEFVRYSGKSSVEFGKIVLDSNSKEKVCEWRSVLNLDDCKKEPISSVNGQQVMLFNRDIKLGKIVQTPIHDYLSRGRVVKTSWVASIYLPETGEIVPEVMADDLNPITHWLPQNKVYFKGWFGIVKDVEWEIKLDFLNTNESKTFNIKNGVIEPLASKYKRISQYEKFRIPYSGQLKKISMSDLEKGYSSVDVLNKPGILSGPLSALSFGVNKRRLTKIAHVKPKAMEINWVNKITNSKDPEPPRWFFDNYIDKIDGDFDMDFMDNLRKHTYCSYLVKTDDTIIKVEDWTDYLYQKYKNEWENRLKLRKINASSSSRTIKSNVPTCLKIFRRSNKKKSQRAANSSSNCGEPISRVAEVISCQQLLEIQFDDGETRRMLSKDVQKVSNKNPGQFRQFVSKKPRLSLEHFGKNLIGIVKDWDLYEDYVTVQWTIRDENLSFLTQIEERMEPKYDLIPHPQFGNVRFGAVVYRSESCSDKSFTYGVVKEVLEDGQVLILKSNSDLIELWPMEFTLLDDHKSSKTSFDSVLKPLCKSNQETTVGMSESTLGRLFNNLRLFTKKSRSNQLDESKSENGSFEHVKSEEIYARVNYQLKKMLPENIWIVQGENKLNLMIVGPSGTPFEDGLFEFVIYIPSAYPLKAPRIALGKNNLIKNLRMVNGYIVGPYFDPCGESNMWNRYRACTVYDSIMSLYGTVFVTNPPPPFELCQPILVCEQEMINEYYRDLTLQVVDSILFNLNWTAPDPFWRNRLYIYTVNLLPKLAERLNRWIHYREFSGSAIPSFSLSRAYLVSLLERFEYLANFMNNNV